MKIKVKKMNKVEKIEDLHEKLRVNHEYQKEIQGRKIPARNRQAMHAWFHVVWTNLKKEELELLKLIEQEEERLLAEEELLRQQEWMNAMDVAYEQGIYK